MVNTSHSDESQTAKTLLSSEDSGTADFEEAISATKFGKFNLILILISIPSGWSSVFEATTMSYVFPAAQCDLSLNLDNKGLLNAITYIGMISSGLIWGFLCDTLGRKKLLYIGFFLDALFVIMSSVSQTFTVLMISKFLGGFIINGPFAALTTYVSEFHCAKYRARVQMVLGIIFSTATICLPLLAQFILPADINFIILDNLRIHSWNVYLLVTAIPAILAGCVFIFLPESPKFLMTTGRSDQALAVFQMVYSLNTGNSRNMYPVTKLINEKSENKCQSTSQIPDRKGGKKQALLEGWSSLRPLFISPLLQNILLVCGLQMLIMMSLNTLRLWIPQLFQAINDYEYYNNGTSADLCTMLEVIRPSNITEQIECVVNTNNSQVYVNSMIIASITVCGYVVAGSLINIAGKKRLLFILGTIGGLSAYSLYFATNTVMTLILASFYITVGSIGINVILSVVVDLFPTALRTMAVSMAMMCGRLGAMSGNLLFPFLLKTGCAPPFYSIGTVMLSSAFICLLLPNTDMKALQTMTVSMAMMCGRIGAMGGNLIFTFLLKTGFAAPFFSIATVSLISAFLSLFLPNTDMKALQ